MGAIGYYIFYGINWVLSFLPLWILYLISDFIYLLLFYFPSYRRKVVETNLKNSFPEKTPAEIRLIEKKFYKHLADLFIETFKLTPHVAKMSRISDFTYSNLGIIDKLRDEKRDIIAVLGHYNNWEWSTMLPDFISSTKLL